MAYNSEADTLKHIKRVSELITGTGVVELISRANRHDDSKLQPPEKEIFDKYTPRLKSLTYGSPEWNENMDILKKEGLEHHYQHNSHHPEHFKNGVNGMDIFDVIEMLFDWKAASERHDDGDIFKSLEINRKRFGISDQLYEILHNTAVKLWKNGN